MIWTTRNLKSLAIAGALAATPAMMLVGYTVFGHISAAHFGIYDMAADYGEGVLAALLLLMLIQFWPVPRAHRRVLTLLWLVRIGITLGMMLAFEAIYRGDMPGYFLGGMALSDPLGAIAFGEGTENVQAVVGLLGEVTGSYSAIKVIFSYVGLIAVYVFYRAAVICLGAEAIILLYVLGLFPSMTFWSSLLGKDPIVLLGIAIYCYGVAGLFVRQRLTMLVWVFLGLLIASSIRVWLGVIFAAPLVFTYVMAGRVSLLAKLAFVAVAIPGFLLAMEGFAERFRVESAEDIIATTEYVSSAWARGGSGQTIGTSFDSFGAMLAFMPVGAFTALFRPLPFEVPNLFGVLAGIENAFILGLFLLGLWRRGVGWLRQPVLLWAATTVVVWGAAYGFVSYQNLGTAFRFRVQVVPILLLLGLYLVYAHRLRPRADVQPGSRPVAPVGDEAEAAHARG